MANEHIEVENKKKAAAPERRYIVYSTDKDKMERQSGFLTTRQGASDYVYDLIQKGHTNIAVFQEVPYRIQI